MYVCTDFFFQWTDIYYICRFICYLKCVNKPTNQFTGKSMSDIEYKCCYDYGV